MRRIYFSLIACVVALTGFTQETPKPTSSFTINGKVKAPKVFAMTDLKKLNPHNLGDVVIANHKGEVKGTAKELTGVLLTQVLGQVELDAETP